ncbi:nucleotidyl transferase AbiEii/AbiGii toxin family protein [Candidatus Collierbacteria bacterium]|nr:nucleotidyl transferase AbiEii/AbiGii toxin family protein [Candidatus Collierbacteria bacterium]
MITLVQLKSFARQYKTNDATVFREYLQLLFLSRLYGYSDNRQIVFKGGTAIHFIYNAPRFSEDLDFTVVMPEKEFTQSLKKTFAALESEGQISFKQRKTLTGKRFLLTAALPDSSLKSFINLDFSFREKVFEFQFSFIKSEYPILFTSQVPHMSKNEIVADKIRAIMRRKKGRDIYDLWYLLAQGARADQKLIAEKFKYYDEKFIFKKLIERIEEFPKTNFINDLKPFVQFQEREKLGELFVYIIGFLKHVSTSA